MQSLYRNVHAIVLTIAFAVAIAAFSISGAFAQQASKLVFEERATDSKTAVEFDTEGRIEISWRATGGQFKVTVVDPGNNDNALISSAPQQRLNADAPPMVGKLPFSRPGKLKLKIDASGPWHVRVVQFTAQ